MTRTRTNMTGNIRTGPYRSLTGTRTDMTGKHKDRIIQVLSRTKTTDKYQDRIILVLDEDENEYDR